MDLRLEYQNVLADRVGEAGLTREELAAARDRFAPLIEEMRQERRIGKHSFLDLPYQTAGVEEWERHAAGVRQRFKNLVVIGMGGSTLGFSALWRACAHPFANLKSRRPGAVRVFVLENIDPYTVASLFEVARPRDTYYNVISKSGSTPETAANFLVLLEKLRKARPDTWREHLAITTDPDKGPLRTFASREGIAAFPVPPGVGGRFSVLSAVGMLPAAIAGIPLGEVLEGAQAMDRAGLGSVAAENLPFQLALVHNLLDRKGISISVLMPYADGLADLGKWFRQLWAESLGKRVDTRGNEVFAGQTPVDALGAVDQHSQIQLYAEGPNDKVIGFLTTKKHRKRVRIPEGQGVGGIDYLERTGLDKLLEAEKQGTEVALTEAGRPNYTVVLPEIGPRTLGALFYVLEVAVVHAGQMLGINPYDQPGVEAGKKAAAALLGREGMGDEKKRIRSRLRADRQATIEW